MGPLKGYKIVELAGIGPGPMCAMLLADMGAEVIRIDRTIASGLGTAGASEHEVLNRSRRSLALDLKMPEGRDVIFRLIDQADALIEGFRPGVMERLGLGPDVCLKRNARLVYGRMTGWGQEGPIAHAAGHDINYIALSGALHAIGLADGAPVIPLNLIGDFGGGALYLAMGVLAGLLEARNSGQGQVVDAAMIDGAASLMTMFYARMSVDQWNDSRQSNAVDGGSHYYQVYETKDGEHITVGSIEAKFYSEFLELTGIEGEELPDQLDREQWPTMRERLAGIFRQKTRDEWCRIMEGSDVCFAPVLSLAEAPTHPHNKSREVFVEIDGITQPAPAPRFSRTQSEISRPPAIPGGHTDEILTEWGFSGDEISGLHENGAVARTQKPL
jgi:alpha-methylacyl-CoA racemase